MGNVGKLHGGVNSSGIHTEVGMKFPMCVYARVSMYECERERMPERMIRE